MQKQLTKIVISCMVLSVFISCSTIEATSDSVPIATGTPLASSYTKQEVEISVFLLDESKVKSKWGNKWPRNPFLPYVSTFMGKKFDVYPIAIQSNTTVPVVIYEPQGIFEGKPVVGQAYDKSNFIDFWLNVTTDEDNLDWEKKKRDIESTVPYLKSAIGLNSGTMYVVPFVVPNKSTLPDTIIIELLVNGNIQKYEMHL